MEQPAPAYQGEEPFVFVSYSHLDEELVYREIRGLVVASGAECYGDA